MNDYISTGHDQRYTHLLYIGRLLPSIRKDTSHEIRLKIHLVEPNFLGHMLLFLSDDRLNLVRAKKKMFTTLVCAALVMMIWHLYASGGRAYVRGTPGTLISTSTFNGSYLSGGMVARRTGPESVRDYNHFLGPILINNNYPWAANRSDIVFQTLDDSQDSSVLLESWQNEGIHASFEDPRIFPVRDNVSILTYTKVLRTSSGQSSMLLARTIDDERVMGPPVRLRRSEDDNAVHKNWILLYCSPDLSDTHWSCFLQPRHEVIRVDLRSGVTRAGWSTESPSLPSPLLRALHFSYLRGGTNVIRLSNTLIAFGHIKSPVGRIIAPCRYVMQALAPYRILKVDAPRYVAGGFQCEYPMSWRDGLMLVGVNNEAVIQVRMEHVL